MTAGTITVPHAAEPCEAPPVCTAATEAELCDIDPAPMLDTAAVDWAEDAGVAAEIPPEVVAIDAVAADAAPVPVGVKVVTSPFEAVYSV